MAWLQLVHKVGLNSLIIAHQGAGSDEIKDMFDRMIKNYPVDMLHKLGETYSENEPKMVGVGKSGSIHRVPQRNCKIKLVLPNDRTLAVVETTTLCICPR